MANTSKTSQVIAKFVEKVSVDQDYGCKDLSKLLEASYKEIYNTKGKRCSNTSEKKPPSAYNLFIKAEIEKIKAENTDGNIDPKDYMRVAAQRWKANKES